MKVVKNYLMLFTSIALTSCQGYHYVSNLPATPEFEHAGQMQGQAAIGTNHIEAQTSVSFSNHIAASFTTFNGKNSINQHLVLHGYTSVKADQSLFVSANFGYFKGHHENSIANSFMGGSALSITDNKSNYEGLSYGLGIYGKAENNRKKFGFYANFETVKFYTIYSLDDVLYNDAFRSWNLKTPSIVTYFKPSLVYTWYSRNQIFFIRGSLNSSIPLFDSMTFWYSSNAYNPRRIETKTWKPAQALLTFSCSVGFNLDFSGFIKPRNK